MLWINISNLRRIYIMNMLTLNSKQIGKVVFKATVGYYIGKTLRYLLTV